MPGRIRPSRTAVQTPLNTEATANRLDRAFQIAANMNADSSAASSFDATMQKINEALQTEPAEESAPPIQRCTRRITVPCTCHRCAKHEFRPRPARPYPTADQHLSNMRSTRPKYRKAPPPPPTWQEAMAPIYERYQQPKSQSHVMQVGTGNLAQRYQQLRRERAAPCTAHKSVLRPQVHHNPTAHWHIPDGATWQQSKRSASRARSQSAPDFHSTEASLQVANSHEMQNEDDEHRRRFANWVLDDLLHSSEPTLQQDEKIEGSSEPFLQPDQSGSKRSHRRPPSAPLKVTAPNPQGEPQPAPNGDSSALVAADARLETEEREQANAMPVAHRPAPRLKGVSTSNLAADQVELAKAKFWKSRERRDAAQDAAAHFDVRQRSLRHSATLSIRAAAGNPTEMLASRAFALSSKELFRNRYFIPEKPPPPPPQPKARKVSVKVEQERAWRLETSIWAGRQFRGGENRGFYDDDSIRRRAIECDFGKALAKGLLKKFLLKHETNAPCPDTQPNETAAFIDEVQEVFVSNARMFFMIFDYYASLSPTDDIFHIYRNGYDRLIQQCGLQVKGSQHCDLAHLDIIFSLVNASTEAAAKNQVETSQRKGSALKAVASHDDKNSLNRAELIQCMCRIAVARYVLTPKTAKTPKAGKTSVTEAIVELFKTIRSHAGREVCQNSYDFRRLNCYNEEADTALRAHENALRVLFAKYSSGEGKCENSKRTLRRQESTKFVASSSKMLSPGEWICMCRDLGFIAEDLSMEDARLIFMWSRMRVIDEDNPEMRRRIENLTFWGFLEAIIRVAQRKAMPTDDEVKAAGYRDGGDFLIRLAKDDPSAYRAFVVKNAKQWWEPTRQPTHKKLSILLSLVMNTLAKNLQRWEKDGSMGKAQKEAEVHRKKSEDALANVEAQSEATEGFDDEGTLSEEALHRLSAGLDEQATVLNTAALTIQTHARGRIARSSIEDYRKSLADPYYLAAAVETMHAQSHGDSHATGHS